MVLDGCSHTCQVAGKKWLNPFEIEIHDRLTTDYPGLCGFPKSETLAFGARTIPQQGTLKCPQTFKKWQWTRFHLRCTSCTTPGTATVVDATLLFTTKISDQNISRFDPTIPSPVHIQHPISMVPMEGGNSLRKTMVSFRGWLILGRD